MLKVAQVVGARPQFIKYFPISKAFATYKKRTRKSIVDILIHTGQHYDYNMSKIFFDEFNSKEPDYHLGVGSGSHGKQTAEILKRVEDVLIKEKPNIVVLYGDTNSTLGGALAAAKLHIPIAHVESGLRSFNKYMPEEINRILTDHISTLLFCPSGKAVQNLKHEGFNNILNDGELIRTQVAQSLPLPYNISQPAVLNVGDVMYDVFLYAVKIAEKQSVILKQLNLTQKGYGLLTLHRPENTDSSESMSRIIEFVNDTSTGIGIIFPMHPRTIKFYENMKRRFAENIKIVDPLGYFDMLMLLKNASFIMTDSGGMQKEAYWLKVPCITLRQETEWTETIESGWNVLYKNYKGVPSSKQSHHNYYGDGKTAEKIASFIVGAM
jgi:UDP-N-acetylglucosamine 2-epimerase